MRHRNVFSTSAFPHPIHFTKEKTDSKGKAIQRIPCLVQFPERRANSGGIDWVAVSDHRAMDQALLRRNATLVQAQKRSSALFAKACLIRVMSAQLSNRANVTAVCIRGVLWFPCRQRKTAMWLFLQGGARTHVIMSFCPDRFSIPWKLRNEEPTTLL